MIHENILRYRGARYLWWSLLLVVASVILYATQGSFQPPNGGTWQGYVLGSIGTALIVWLSLLGIRKRNYRSRLGSVQGWVSAHVYLGSALLIVATLHSAAQFNWNIHTLAYVLMCLVIFSGFFGTYSYMLKPRLVSVNRVGRTREDLFAELYQLDRQGVEVSSLCGPDIQIAMRSAIERTVIGGGVINQLRGHDHSKMIVAENRGSGIDNEDQRAIIDLIGRRIPRADKASEAANLHTLLALACRRQEILRRIREDIRLHGWMKIWLYLHVPATVALLAALTIHILTTFFYW